jgi:hypothetical protein
MEILFIIFLIIALVFLFLMKRQERIREYDSPKSHFSRPLNSREAYLKKVKDDTENRLNFEKKEQQYKSDIKKEYL